jgi:drug/metabolite transporter (DMT)-like permease
MDPPAPMQKPSAPEPLNRPRDRAKAIVLMLLALVLFSCLDAAAKYLATVTRIPVAEIVWLRFLVQFVLILVLAPVFGLISLEQLFTTRKLKHQMLRSTLMVATTAFNFLALEHLRLDQTITIVFLAPLVVALLAGPVLGEWVGWRRLVAILIGFSGILIAVRPGLAGVHPAVLYAIAAMLAYAIFMLATRYLSAYDPPLVTLFYSMLVGTFFGAPVAFANWVWPTDLPTWLLLGSLGILGGGGHWLFIHAYRLAPASSITPFLYTQLLSMIALGYLVFGDVPDLWTLAGALVIVGSGVYLFHRERITATS